MDKYLVARSGSHHKVSGCPNTASTCPGQSLMSTLDICDYINVRLLLGSLPGRCLQLAERKCLLDQGLQIGPKAIPDCTRMSLMLTISPLPRSSRNLLSARENLDISLYNLVYLPDLNTIPSILKS